MVSVLGKEIRSSNPTWSCSSTGDKTEKEKFAVGHFRGCAVAWGQDHPHHHQHQHHHHYHHPHPHPHPHSHPHPHPHPNFKIIFRAQEKTVKCGGITAEGH